MSNSALYNIGVTTDVYFNPTLRRPFITEIWYPIDENAKTFEIFGVWEKTVEARDAPIRSGGKKWPLIIFSHGHASSRLDTSWLLEKLAAQGYIVAAFDHFGNTWYYNRPLSSVCRWERVQDTSFFLDQILQDPKWSAHIDPERIGFAGFSIGGLVGVWLAGGQAQLFVRPKQIDYSFLQASDGRDEEIIATADFSHASKSYRDDRFKAAFLMAPAYGFEFDEAGLADINIPIYIVAGEGDQIVTIDEIKNRFAKWIPHCELKILPGKVNHFAFLNVPSQIGKKLLPPRITFDHPTVDRTKIHEEITGLAIDFFDRHLKKENYAR